MFITRAIESKESCCASAQPVAIIGSPPEFRRTVTPSDPAPLLTTHGAAIDRAIVVVCRRARLNVWDAEDLAQETWTHLLENDSEAIRRFQGRSGAETYFVRVAARVLADMRRRQSGRWRPSRPLRRLGPLARELETLILRDGFTPHEAIEIVRARWTASPTELDSIVERIVASSHRRRRPLVVSGLRTIDPQVDISTFVDPERLFIERDWAASHFHVVRVIRTAWRLLSVEEQSALANRFAGNSRDSASRDSSWCVGFRMARDRLRDLLASGGVDWPMAFDALRHIRLDLGLQGFARNASDTTSIATNAGSSEKRREEKRREEKDVRKHPAEKTSGRRRRRTGPYRSCPTFCV
jgi:DNA-directed RNA polymerase specialized sigma24 family protein